MPELPSLSALGPVDIERYSSRNSSGFDSAPSTDGSGRVMAGIPAITPVKPLRRTSSLVSSGYVPASPGSRNSGSSGRSSINAPAFTPDFEVVFAEPLDKIYECPVCGQYLKQPVQFAECGHRCCNACLEEILRVAAHCPVDQTPFNRNAVTFDKECQKIIENLPIKCRYAETGCKWTAPIAEFLKHLTDDCLHVTVRCPNDCGIEFQKSHVGKHAEEECPRREIVCGHCEETILAGDEDDHMNVCPHVPVKCPNNCKTSRMTRQKVASHLKDECPLQTISCPFQPFGCNVELERTKIVHHLDDSPKIHLDLVCSAMTEHKKLIEENTFAIESQRDFVINVKSKVETLLNVYGVQFLWKIDNVDERVADAKGGKKSTIFSPAFYTHRHGYKMAVSACLNGDGIAKGKYMSLFICLCRGEFDALLQWPFGHKISLTLVDQCNDKLGRRNIVYTIKPNTCKENRPFLGRPSSERNASFGAQQFGPLKTVMKKSMDYIRDNTMYIKVAVDLTELPSLSH